MTESAGDRTLAALAGLHALAAVAHGVPHRTAGVALAPWQTAVVAVTVLGPFAAAALAGRRPRAAPLAFAALVAVSVVFGVTHHWLVAGVDNVRSVSAPRHAAFEWTAVLLAAVGALGAFYGYSRSAR